MLIRKAVLFVVPVACIMAVGSVSTTLAILIPGGGPKKTDCFIELEVEGVAAPFKNTVNCTDGDPECDKDGACNNICDMKVRACLRQTDPAVPQCVLPTALTKASAKVKGPGAPSLAVPALDSSTCGAFLDNFDVAVKTRRGKDRPDKTIISTGKFRGKMDKDTLKFVCVPRTGACPTTTTVTTTSTTTSTLAPRCGDGTVNGVGEECDPPCGGGCGGGQLCDGDCHCVTQNACTCGAPDPQFLKFTTAPFSSTATGSLEPRHCAQCATGTCTIGAACTTDLDCVGGFCRGDLTEGGLYFGSGTVPNPLPAAIPDLGISFNEICCSGNTLSLSATTAGQTAGTEAISNKSCSSAGCFFGAPLPILNGPALSTCVINTIAFNSHGTADCTTGATTIDLPLTSTIYLTGDFLNGQSATQPNIAGIQPCPICTGGTCKGGPRNGMACTAGTTALTEAYPTSQDCPVGNPALGSLPIPFLLSTGTQTKTATDTDGAGPQVRTYCAFCRDPDSSAFEGAPTSGPAVPCTSNADCSRSPFTVCEQMENGAFGNTFATTITETGLAGGNLTDRQPHTARLISVFCIPPTFSGLVDPAAGLPGPGAVSLPGQAQLVP